MVHVIGAYQMQTRVPIANNTTILEIHMAVTIKENAFGSQIKANVSQRNLPSTKIGYLTKNVQVILLLGNTPYDFHNISAKIVTLTHIYDEISIIFLE